MFDFAPVGIGICVVSLIYLSFAWRLLPKDRRGKPSAEDQFSIEDYVSEVKLAEGSTLIGKTVGEVEDSVEGNISVMSIVRNGEKFMPSSRMKMRENDILFLKATL